MVYTLKPRRQSSFELLNLYVLGYLNNKCFVDIIIMTFNYTNSINSVNNKMHKDVHQVISIIFVTRLTHQLLLPIVMSIRELILMTRLCL